MAIIKNGKIHGKLGNYVYRVVNGKEIIQSYPRFTKQRGGSILENESFGKISQQSSKIYRLVKDFALNGINTQLYNEMVRFFKRNFSSDHEIIHDPLFDNWRDIPSFDRLVINSNIQPGSILLKNPIVTINEESCFVQFPKFELYRGLRKKLNSASHIAFGFRLIHYDFSSGMAQIVFELESERFSISKGFEEQYFTIPLSVNNVPIEKGLLIFAYGLRFFASSQSFGYINTKEFNPSVVSGIWYKK
jgi:hypothetical protein